MNYIDGRSNTNVRLPVIDQGVVLPHGDAFDSYGARDLWVWEHEGTYFMHYDAADPEVGWLCALATSTDLIHWKKHGTVLSLGEPQEEDSKSASYGVTYLDNGIYHMFYLGTPNTSPAPERAPAFPYLTMKAMAYSPNGPWHKQPTVIPFRPIPDTYCHSTASPGHIIRLGNEYLQFFSASVQGNNQTLMANGLICSPQPGIPYKENIYRTLSIARTKDLNGPWQIDPEPILPLEEQIENSSLYYDEPSRTWFLFTNHVGINENYQEYTDAVWVYWSQDPTRWDKRRKAIALDGKSCSWSKTTIGLPGVLKVGDRLAILYDGQKDGGIFHCHRDIGLAFASLSDLRQLALQSP